MRNLFEFEVCVYFTLFIGFVVGFMMGSELGPIYNRWIERKIHRLFERIGL